MNLVETLLSHTTPEQIEAGKSNRLTYAEAKADEIIAKLQTMPIEAGSLRAAIVAALR